MSAAPQPVASLFDEFDLDEQCQFDWPTEEIAAYDARHSAPVMQSTPLEIVPKRRTLGDYVSRVEFLADTIEALDDDQLDEETRDELSGALIAELAGTRTKVDAVASTLAMFEHLTAAARTESERLDKRAEYFERQRERLERYVLAVLEASKLDKLEGDTNTLARRLNPARVVIDDAEAVPAEYMRRPEPVPPPPALPDKKAIAAALTAKRCVPGCRLEQGVRLVRS